MSNYKKLGDYILKGLSMTKEFRESTSNTVGTDMSKYRIVDQWHFACDFMSTIRVHAFPVVLNIEKEPVLVSPAYPVFKVNDHNKLDPEYLMMWFRRPEFDRYADFKCDGAIRGGFGWEDLCEVELPIPSIEKQREIVNEYNTVVNRIKLNEQLNQKLEETAQALYKHWFVDFEFPNEDGLPYKSNGGKMVYNEELDKEVPLGWEVNNFFDLVTVKYGKSYSHLNSGHIPLYGSGGIMGFVDNVLYDKETILIPRKGTLSNIMHINHPFWSVDTMFYTELKKNYIGHYLFQHLIRLDFNALNLGSAVPSMTTAFLNNMKVLNPNKNILKQFQIKMLKFDNMVCQKIQNQFVIDL